MQTEILADDAAVAQRAASLIAAEIRAVVAKLGACTLAVSGGKTPWAMLRALAAETLPWEELHLLQIDERVAPDGDDARNLTHILECISAKIPADNLHAMPVGIPDLDVAAAHYAATLAQICEGRLDIAHLGLGPDGHTASLIPGDPVLKVTDVDVAPTGVYQGHRRLTLTYPTLNRAGKIVWLATGASKTPMLRRLLVHDPSIPAGRVKHENAIVLADRAALPSP
jgi:6-phosphogluconolactonase